MSILQGCSDHWRSLFQKSYSVGVPLTPAQHRAAELATSWKKLFQSRFLAQNDVTPWEKPSTFEIQAASKLKNYKTFSMVSIFSSILFKSLPFPLFFLQSNRCTLQIPLSKKLKIKKKPALSFLSTGVAA
jgi:hypothetical protein